MTWTPIYWLLLFLPALIALYFLKLKRVEAVVSSTILWRRSVEDLHVNAPFQKLRRSLLLLLQLLILAALIIALWRPRSVGELEAGRNMLLLIDRSASMSAEDGDGTRLDAAKARARELIEAMKSGDRAAVLTFAARTQTIEPITSDTGSLLRAVESIEVTAAPTNLVQALTVAGALADALPGSVVQVLGDGCYVDPETLPEEVKRQNVQFHSSATAIDNVAIVDADVRHTFETRQRTEVLAVVENAGASEWKGTVGIYFEPDESPDGDDGGPTLRDADELTIPPGQSRPALFDASEYGAGMARIEIDAGDGLGVDDRAWVRIDFPDPVRVKFVGVENEWIELVLKASRRVRSSRLTLAEYEDAVRGVARDDVSETLAADVVIFDREAPSALPVLPSLFIGCVPPLPLFEKRTAVEYPQIIDKDGNHPVNRFLTYTDLSIEKASIFPESNELRPIVHSDEGPLVATLHHREPGASPVPYLLVGFNILDSNWPLGHYSFPIFFANAVEWLRREEGGAQSRFRTGEPLVFRPPRGEDEADWAAARIQTPSGATRIPTRDEDGAIVLASTNEVGLYSILAGDARRARVAVGLLSSAESRLSPREKINFGAYEVTVSTEAEQGTTHYWKWFALAAVLVLFGEWYVYNRRLGM